MKRPPGTRSTAGGAVVALCVAMTQAALAEVRSATLGIDINCPSGLSE
jgi:hypothetical protein